MTGKEKRESGFGFMKKDRREINAFCSNVTRLLMKLEPSCRICYFK